MDLDKTGDTVRMHQRELAQMVKRLFMISNAVTALMILAGCQLERNSKGSDQNYSLDFIYVGYIDANKMLDALSKYEKIPEADTKHPGQFFVKNDFYLFGHAEGGPLLDGGKQTKEEVVNRYYPHEHNRYRVKPDLVGMPWADIPPGEPVIEVYVDKGEIPVMVICKDGSVQKTSHDSTPDDETVKNWQEIEERIRSLE